MLSPGDPLPRWAGRPGMMRDPGLAWACLGRCPGACLWASLGLPCWLACFALLRASACLVLRAACCLALACALVCCVPWPWCLALVCAVLCAVYPGLCVPVCMGYVLGLWYTGLSICLLCLKLGPFGKRAFVISGFTEIRNSVSMIIAYFQLDSGLNLAFSCIFH